MIIPIFYYFDCWTTIHWNSKSLQEKKSELFLHKQELKCILVFDGFIYVSLAKRNSHLTRIALSKTAVSLTWQYSLDAINKSMLSLVWAVDLMIVF